MEEEISRRLRGIEDDVKRITAKHPKVPRIQKVPAGGTLADVIRTLNELIDRIQDEE